MKKINLKSCVITAFALVMLSVTTFSYGACRGAYKNEFAFGAAGDTQVGLGDVNVNDIGNTNARIEGYSYGGYLRAEHCLLSIGRSDFYLEWDLRTVYNEVGARALESAAGLSSFDVEAGLGFIFKW